MAYDYSPGMDRRALLSAGIAATLTAGAGAMGALSEAAGGRIGFFFVAGIFGGLAVRSGRIALAGRRRWFRMDDEGVRWCDGTAAQAVRWPRVRRAMLVRGEGVFFRLGLDDGTTVSVPPACLPPAAEPLVDSLRGAVLQRHPHVIATLDSGRISPEVGAEENGGDCTCPRDDHGVS